VIISYNIPINHLKLIAMLIKISGSIWCLPSGCAAVGQGLALIIGPAAPPPGDLKGEGAAATEGADIIVWWGAGTPAT